MHAKLVAIIVPEMPKLVAKPERLLFSLPSESLDGGLTVLIPWLYLNKLAIYVKIVAFYVPKTPKWSQNQRVCSFLCRLSHWMAD